MKCKWCDNEATVRVENKVLDCPTCGAVGVFVGGHMVTSFTPGGGLFDDNGDMLNATDQQVARYVEWAFPKNFKSGQVQCRKCGFQTFAKVCKDGLRQLFEAESLCKCGHYEVYALNVDTDNEKWRLL